MTAQANARQLVTVAGKTVEKLEYHGRAVVTLSMIDEIHGRPYGTAGRNFRSNKKQFEENIDFFVITAFDEIRRIGIVAAPNGLTLLTESGYLKLVKTFTDDLAWQVQGQLVECYFHVKQTLPAVPAALPTQFELMKLAMGAIEEATNAATQALEATHTLTTQQQVLSTGLAETRHDLNKFIEERRLENWQQAAIIKAVNHKVEVWREMYPALNVKKAYPAIWRHIKEKFNVPRYNEIPSKEYDRAIATITKLNLCNLAGL